MRSSRDLDRRTFLKLGAAGTAVAAINPSIGLASVQTPPARSRLRQLWPTWLRIG